MNYAQISPTKFCRSSTNRTIFFISGQIQNILCIWMIHFLDFRLCESIDSRILISDFFNLKQKNISFARNLIMSTPKSLFYHLHWVFFIETLGIKIVLWNEIAETHSFILCQIVHIYKRSLFFRKSRKYACSQKLNSYNLSIKTD